MKIKYLIVVLCLISSATFAKPAGVVNGPGRVGVGANAAMPPGLHGKAYPHGLYKKNKTPHGWTKGQKRGWNKNLRNKNKIHKAF